MISDAGFAKQLGAPKPLEFVLSFLSRKVRKAAKKLGVRYEFFFMHCLNRSSASPGGMEFVCLNRGAAVRSECRISISRRTIHGRKRRARAAWWQRGS